MNTFDVIFSRQTIRSFKQERVDWEIIADILQYADKLPKLADDIAIEFKLVSNIEANQGFHNPFSVKAPYYICISSEKKGDYLLNAGYLMQNLNLYIESKGLGSCFLGHTSPGTSLKSMMKYDYITAIAFGYTDKPLFRNMEDANRLSDKELVVYKEEVSQDIKQLLLAAKLAPSFFNLQPWRFVVYNNRIHVFAKKNLLISKLLDNNKMIDIGIMLANLLLAAEEMWLDTSITKMESMKQKHFKNNEYILTVVIG